MSSARWFWPGRRAATGCLAIALAGGVFGCRNTDTYPDPPPAAGALQPHALIGRLQDRALTFYGEHVADLLRDQHETRIVGGRERIVVDLPEVSVAGGAASVRDGCVGAVDPTACPPADATFRSRFELDLEQLARVATGRWLVGAFAQEAEIRFGALDLFSDFALVLDQGIDPPVVCHLADADPALAAAHLDSLGFHLTATPDAGGHLVIAADPATHALGTFDLGALTRLSVTPCNDALAGCEDPLCAAGDCVGVCRAGQGIFAVDPLRDTILDPLVGAGPDAALDAVAATSVAAVTDTLLGFSSTVAAAAVLPSGWTPPPRRGGTLQLGVGQSSPAMQLSGPSGWRGVSLGLDIGSFGEMSPPCAPAVVIPTFGATQGPPPYFDGVIDVVDPRTGQGHADAYHVVVTLAQRTVEQLGMSLLRMGGLCPRLSPAVIASLTGLVPGLDTLALWAPGVAALGSGALSGEIHPTEPAVVRFGSGARIGTDADGAPVYDSLLTISLGDLGLSIYARIDGSETRLGTVAADVGVGLAIVRAPGNALELAVDRVTVENGVVVATELPGIDLAPAAVPLLYALVEGALAAAPSIDIDLIPTLAAALGNSVSVHQRINAVRREGFSDGGYLSAYITFCDDADLTDPLVPACSVPPASRAAPVRARLGARRDPGAVVIHVDAAREVQVRVDTGPWSRFFAPDDALVVRSERLARRGSHMIHLRSRPPGMYWARRDEPALEVPGR